MSVLDREAFYLEVAEECVEYAKKYNCTYIEALKDWEGDGPEGSWGLGLEAYEAVEGILGEMA